VTRLIDAFRNRLANATKNLSKKRQLLVRWQHAQRAVTSCVYQPTQQKEKLLRIIDVNWGSTVPSCSAESRFERRSKFKLLSAGAAE
jgi:hypothetical protein